MAETVGFTASRDLGERLGHAMQAKGVKLVEGFRVFQYGRTRDIDR
jgi:hypothetical protein